MGDDAAWTVEDTLDYLSPGWRARKTLQPILDEMREAFRADATTRSGTDAAMSRDLAVLYVRVYIRRALVRAGARLHAMHVSPPK